MLPKPILKDNPHYKCAAPMKLWEESAVKAVMETEEFKKKVAGSEKRKEAAKKAVETKRENAELMLDDLLKSIRVERIDLKQLRHNAIAAKQFWYDWNGRDDYRSAYDADEETVQRWMVNYVRHNLCNYDESLNDIFGKTGKTALYCRLKGTILDEIANTYPELACECEQQKCGY